MIARASLICLAILGVSAGPPASRGAPSAALVLWQEGQTALADGDAARAIRCFETSLRLEPDLTRNHLSLAACRLAEGDDEQASVHLARYVELEPTHATARAHYAELLLRLGKADIARAQFEHFIADVQGDDELARQHLVHSHSRLMEIAEVAKDTYGERLHRGIGLYHLAQQRARLPEPDGELSVEGLLCRAAGELALARRERPGEPRPCWYLHIVWSQLAQAQPAARCLHEAQQSAAFGDLTPTERAALQLAGRSTLASK